MSCSMTDSRFWRPLASISECFNWCVKSKGFPETTGNPPRYAPASSSHSTLINPMALQVLKKCDDTDD